MPQISRTTWEKVNKLSKREIDKLADLMSIEFLQGDLDKDEKILVITTESELKVLKGLEKLEASE